MNQILTFIKSHGFACRVVGDVIVIDIPCVEADRSLSMEHVEVKTFREAKIALGY